MKNSILAAIAALLLWGCEKQNSNMLVKSTNVNESSVEIKGYMYKRADLNNLLNQAGIKMDGVRFYNEGYAVGTVKDLDGYNDYLVTGKSVKIKGYPCPDWCSK